MRRVSDFGFMPLDRTATLTSSLSAPEQQRSSSTKYDTASTFLSDGATRLDYTAICGTSCTWCTTVHIIGAVDCEWDAAKARANLQKDGVHFADAVAVLEDETALTIRDLTSVHEERWITMGMDAFGRVLVVVYTWRGAKPRLISARHATSSESRKYAEGI